MPPKRANPIDFPPPASSSEAEDDTTSGSSDEDGSSSDEEQTLAPSSLPKTLTLTPKSAIPQSSDTKKPTEETDSGSDSESEDDSKLGSGSGDGDSDSDSNEEEEKEEPLPVTTPPPKKATTSKKRKSSNEADETPTPAPAPVVSKSVAENGGKSDDGRKMFQRIWSDADEVAVLEGIIEYKALKGNDAVADINAFRDFIKSRLHFDVSLSQLRDKISKLKKKFKDQYQKDENKTFPSEQNQKLFDLSKVIWGAGAGASNSKAQKKTEKSNAKEEKSHAKAEKSTASQAEKSNAKASQAEKSNAKASQAEKSNAKASQAEKSNAKASQAEKSKAESSKKKAEVVATDEDVVMEASNGVMKMGIDEGRSAGSNKRMKYDFFYFSTCNGSMEDFVTKGLAVLDDEKRSVIEGKWKKFQVEELKLAAKKHALMKEQAELMVAALED